MTIGEIIQALNSPIRRDVIERLKSGPITAGDLADGYNVSKATMSTHFATLKAVGLIEAERDGNSIIYHLNTTVTEESVIGIVNLLTSIADKTSSKTISKLKQKASKP